MDVSIPMAKKSMRRVTIYLLVDLYGTPGGDR